MVNDNINELSRKKVGNNYGVGGQQTPGAEINTPEGIAIARNFLNPSASTKLNEMIDDIRRAATTHIGAPTVAQGNLMNDALQAQLGVTGITGESARGVYEKAKLDAGERSINDQLTWDKQKFFSPAVTENRPGTTPTIGQTSYDQPVSRPRKGLFSTINIGDINKRIDEIRGGK